MIRVAVAVIVDDQQRILITQRPLHALHGGYWEFPGGKLETNERPEDALVREIREEVGLEVLQHHYLGEVHHNYGDRSVQLFIFMVTQFAGKPERIEGQLAMKWALKEELIADNFPEANREIIKLIEELPGFSMKKSV